MLPNFIFYRGVRHAFDAARLTLFCVCSARSDSRCDHCPSSSFRIPSSSAAASIANCRAMVPLV